MINPHRVELRAFVANSMFAMLDTSSIANRLRITPSLHSLPRAYAVPLGFALASFFAFCSNFCFFFCSSFFSSFFLFRFFFSSSVLSTGLKNPSNRACCAVFRFFCSLVAAFLTRSSLKPFSSTRNLTRPSTSGPFQWKSQSGWSAGRTSGEKKSSRASL